MVNYCYVMYFFDLLKKLKFVFGIFFVNKISGTSSRVSAVRESRVVKASFISCFYTNATSLNNKLFELESRLSLLSSPHLVFVTETWFNPVSAPVLRGYFLYRRDRSSR